MNILHIAYISNNKTSGVRNVVPKYLKYESEYSKICLLDCNEESGFTNNGENYEVVNIKNLKDLNIDNLPQPFNRPDLVVFHAIYYIMYIGFYKQLKNRKIPYIIVPHGSMAKNAQAQKFFKKKMANFLIFNKFLKSSIAIQYLCKEEKENSVFKKNKSIIAGSGIEINGNVKKFIENTSEEFVITYIGRYDYKSKGLDILVEACNDIKEQMREKNIKLKLYGNDYRGRIKKLEYLIRKYELDDIIELNGPVYDSAKKDVLLQSDVFIQTSKSEGQSLGLMESISLGIPCIVTPGTNFGEIVEKYDFGYCCLLNKNDIGQKILKAFNDRYRLSEMSNNAINYANNNFDWKKVIHHTLNEYEGVIDGSK